MSQAVLDRNLEALGARGVSLLPGSAAALAARVDRSAAPWQAEVEWRPGRWRRLHSARDPLGEARQQAGAAAGGDGVTHVLIGGGLGYLPQVWLDERAAPRVIVIEPSPELATACLARRDWHDALASGRLIVRVWPGAGELPPLWQLFDSDDPEPAVTVHPVLASAVPELASRIREQVGRSIFEGRANAEARRRQAGRYLLNTIHNLPAIASSADAASLAGILRGVPTVLVAAGPSLDSALDDLGRIADRAAIVAVDTAGRPLLNAGIVPHLVVALDPTEANANHLVDLPAHDDVCLVAEPSLDPRAIAEFPGRLITFRVADHHPWPWLAAHGLTREIVRVWGSVLTAALDLAILGGADPIVFVGADLAYTGGRPYCRGAAWESSWAEQTGRGAAIEAQWKADLHARTLEATTDLTGQPTATTPHLVAFRDWLLARMAEAPDRRFINASGAGLLFGGSITCAPLPDLELGRKGVGRAVRAAIADALERSRAAAADTAATLARGLDLIRRDPADYARREWLRFGGATVGPDEVDAAIGVAAAAMSVAPAAGSRPAPSTGLLPAADRAALVRSALTLPDRTVQAAADLQPAVDAARAALLDLLGIATAVDPNVSPHADLVREAGRVPVGVLVSGPPVLRHAIDRFEDHVARAAAIVVSAGSPPVSPDRRLPLATLGLPESNWLPVLLAHEWLSVARFSDDRATASSAEMTRRLLEAVLSGAAARAGGDGGRAEAALTVPGGPTLTFGVAPARAADGLTGLMGIGESVPGRPASGAGLRVLGATGDLARQLAVLDGRVVSVAMRPLLADPSVRAGLCVTRDDHHAIVTTFEGVSSLVVSAAGDSDALPPWPRPVWGEVPWGADGGGFAWHNPDRVVLFRPTAAAKALSYSPPFRPLRVAVLPDGASIWCAFEGGLWRWTPGQAAEKLADTPVPIHLHAGPDGVRVDPATREPDGMPVRRLLRQASFWRWGSSSLEAVDLDEDGQCTSEGSRAGWTARVHPYADTVVVTGPGGLTSRLPIHYALTAAWAGDSLVVCTGEGRIWFLPELTRQIAEASR